MVCDQRQTSESGQAIVETALTLPLTIFLVLGTLQLFMLFQGRAMAQYAVARSTRAGSLKSGACAPMLHTAIAALLPTFTRTRTADELAAAFGARSGGLYEPGQDSGRNESIVWLIRESPTVRPNEEEEFDLASASPQTLGVRLVFWYPLRIPFVNWVLSAIILANFGLRNYTRVNPLLVTQSKSNWDGTAKLDPRLVPELMKRADARHYVAPIVVTYSMRMMTPARAKNFASAVCPPYP
jgi:hypothetical protein